MKILMTSDTYLPRLGGGEYHVFYLARGMRELGHEVTLVVAEGDAWLEDSQHPVIRQRYTGIGSLPSLFGLLWKQSRGCDLIHSHYSYRLACIAATVAFLRRIPFVVTQHGLGLLPQPGATFLQRRAFGLWRWWSMHVACSVISTSDDLSVDIRALGFGDKIVHIPNGYDADTFKPLPAPTGDDPVILAVRRFAAKNGIQYLVAAVPALVERFPRIRCDLVGDGDMRPQLEELAQKLGVEKYIRFLGPLGHDRLIECYRAAHAVIIPSTAESTSLSCIEAMAQAKTIVASRVGGLIELLGSGSERGFLVAITDDEHCNYDAPFTIEPERIARLSDMIIYALTHAAEARTKAELAASYARERYDWRIIVRRTADEVYSPHVTRHP